MKDTYRCVLSVVAMAAVLVNLVGCSPKETVEARTVEDQPSPEEQRYLAAVQPFLDAVVARDYAKAYAFLSRDARASMNLNQFVPPLDDQQYERNRARAISNVQPADFSAWMQQVETEHGAPSKLLNRHVFSTDPKVLAGRGQGLEAVDGMLAIGAMPKSVPVDIRRASLRCQVGTKLSPAQMEQAAKAAGMKKEELANDPDFQPYFNLKVVLVEEEGTLKVGYFEFLPPSMMD